MENKKRRVGGYLIWLGIPILIIAALYYISGNKKPEEHKYSEIMEYFTVGTSANQSEWKASQVSDFNLSLNTGVLTINLKEDKSGKKIKATEIVVAEVTFCEKKKENASPSIERAEDEPQGRYDEVPDDDLPF